MGIQKLPNEILHMVLFYASLNGRVIKRALRLRLVCKTFADMLHPALFETHLMDKVPGLGTAHWHNVNQHGAEKLWHKYLVYRVMGEQDPSVGRFVEMRQTAEAARQKTGIDLQTAVDGICWLALNHKLTPLTYMFCEWGPTMPATANLNLNLLAFAAYFGLMDLAEQLVDVELLRKDNKLFAPPMQIAAQSGNITILRLFQQAILESQDGIWRFESCSVAGAVIRGDLEVLKQVLRPHTTAQGEKYANFDGRLVGTSRSSSSLGYEIRSIMKQSSTPEVYQYMHGLLESPSRALALSNMGYYALQGNMDMVRFLLGTKRQDLSVPLLMACRGLHVDMVELLLDCGAEFDQTDYRGAYYIGSSLSIARLLLDRSNSFPDVSTFDVSTFLSTYRDFSVDNKFTALWWAFERENMDVARLLLERGATFDIGDEEGGVGKSLAEMTYYLGYDSMNHILRTEYGFQIPGPLNDPRGVIPDTPRCWLVKEEILTRYPRAEDAGLEAREMVFLQKMLF